MKRLLIALLIVVLTLSLAACDLFYSAETTKSDSTTAEPTKDETDAPDTDESATDAPTERPTVKPTEAPDRDDPDEEPDDGDGDIDDEPEDPDDEPEDSDDESEDPDDESEDTDDESEDSDDESADSDDESEDTDDEPSDTTEAPEDVTVSPVDTNGPTESTAEPTDTTTFDPSTTAPEGDDPDPEVLLTREIWDALFDELDTYSLAIYDGTELLLAAEVDGDSVTVVMANGDIIPSDASALIFENIRACYSAFRYDAQSGTVVADEITFEKFDTTVVLKNITMDGEGYDLTEMTCTYEGMELTFVFDHGEGSGDGPSDDSDYERFAAIFDVPGVRVDAYVGERLIGSYNIDGNLAEVIDENGVATLCPRSSAPDFDMTPYYEYFTEVEDGLWIAETMPMEEDGMEFLLQNVTVKTENGLLVSLSYDMTVAEAGISMSVALKLSLHGEIEIDVDAQTLAKLEAIRVLEDLYLTEGALDNFTVEKTMTLGTSTAIATYRFDGNVSELIGVIREGDEVFEYDPEITGEYGAGEHFVNQFGGALFWGLDAEALSYDVETGVYTLAGEYDGDGSEVGVDYAIVKNVTFTLADGKLATYTYDVEYYVYADPDAEEGTKVAEMSCVEVYSDWGETVVETEGMDDETYAEVLSRLTYTGERTLDYFEEYYGNLYEMVIFYDGEGKCDVTEVWMGDLTEYEDLDEDAALLQMVNDIFAFVRNCGQDGYIKSANGIYYFVGEYNEDETSIWPQSVQIAIDGKNISIRVDLGGSDVHTCVLGIVE